MPEKEGRKSWTNEIPRKQDQISLSSNDIKSILDVNAKAISIYAEVEQQNSEIIEKLETNSVIIKSTNDNLNKLYPEGLDNRFSKISDKLDKISLDKIDKILELSNKLDKKTEELDRKLFQLQIILGSSTFLAIVAAVIQQFIFKK